MVLDSSLTNDVCILVCLVYYITQHPIHLHVHVCQCKHTGLCGWWEAHVHVMNCKEVRCTSAFQSLSLMQCWKYIKYLFIKEIWCRVNLLSHIYTYMSHSLKLMREHIASTPHCFAWEAEAEKLSNQKDRSCGSLIWRVGCKGGDCSAADEHCLAFVTWHSITNPKGKIYNPSLYVPFKYTVYIETQS